jgi:[acyl-carrier-protein] S-malonyltransferase
MSGFAIVCSGQGAQSPQLFSQFPFSDNALALKERARAVLEPDVRDWLDEPSKDPQAIFRNHFSQPLICLYQAMVWSELKPLLPQPAMVAGYSLGELSAYGCAEALQPEEVIQLASTRARLMDAAGPRGDLIAVTGLPPSVVSEMAGAHLAIVIGEDHWVGGCLAERAESLAAELKSAGARDAVPLAVTVASHTPILDAAVEPFRAALDKVTWTPPRIPVVGAGSAVKILRREQMVQSLPEQIHRTIRWDQVQQRFLDSGCRVVLELGPGRQLARMAASRGLEARAFSEFRSPEGAAAWLQDVLRRSS